MHHQSPERKAEAIKAIMYFKNENRIDAERLWETLSLGDKERWADWIQS